MAHGFTGSWRRPSLRRAALIFNAVAGVISFDFRGHGKSRGMSTVGDREIHDLDAAVAWARELGYAKVATVGFSMGASVAVRHAALMRGAHPPDGASSHGGSGIDTAALMRGAYPPDGASSHGGSAIDTAALMRGAGLPNGALSSGGREGTATDAIVAVSGPARWYYRGTPPMRRVHWVLERRLGRLVGRVALGTRIANGGWDPVPEPPHAVAGQISPTPLLVVHGDADAYFPVEHAHQLYDSAREPKELWLEPGFGHAENAADPDLLQRIGAWIVTHT
ncbi:MAG TPA: alpha/beta hydrolase [Micromonosporaceae bacterium]|nr:alpha/beta hydrolase [Micromonosporaceae bacterium]